MARCVGVRNTDAEIASNARSDDFFFPGDVVLVSSSANSYPLQSSVDERVAMVTSPKFSQCYEQRMRNAAGPESSFEDVTVKITPGSASGPVNVVASGTAIMKQRVNGEQKTVYMSMAFISGPLLTADITANSMDGTPVPASQMESMVAAVANRAAKG